jgi:hypothetical protein
MTCSLILSEKETEMLGYLAGFGGKQIAKHIYDDLTKKFPQKEWEELWETMRSELERQSKMMDDTRMVFTGYKRAMEHERKKES